MVQVAFSASLLLVFVCVKANIVRVSVFLSVVVAFVFLCLTVAMALVSVVGVAQLSPLLPV